MLKFISVICVIFIISSFSEWGYDTANEKKTITSKLLTFDTYPDIDSDLDFDNSFTKSSSRNQPLQLTYIAKHNTTENTTLLKNKYQYVRPRAPPIS